MKMEKQGNTCLYSTNNATLNSEENWQLFLCGWKSHDET